MVPLCAADPVERETSPEPEEIPTALPHYDLPMKREKTKLEEYEEEQKEPQTKPKNTIDDKHSDWDKLKSKKQDLPEKRSSIAFGKGQRPGGQLKVNLTKILSC